MRKKSFYCLLLIGLLVSLSSCQEEQIYSCDPEIDDWVTENLSEIHSLSRSSWLKLDESLKIPTFRAFTIEQKQTFWKLKIQEVALLEWDNLEKDHLQKLYDFISNNSVIFADKALDNEDIYDKFDRFKYEWVEYAEETLGWSRRLIGSIVASGNKLKNKTGILELTPLTYSSKIKSSGESGIWDRDCNCESYDDWCWNGKCLGGACNASRGCGFMLLGDCDGICC